MLEGIECLGHSTIKIHKKGIVIYIDPFKIKQEFHDADYIFITHSHYDHFSKEETYWKNPYQTMLNWGKTAAERSRNEGIF